MAGWKDFREIAAWEHSQAAKIRIYKLLERPAFTRDFKLHGQLRESARSAPANIAEGFGRFGNKEFARFARIAKGSLHESINHLIDARDSRYITDDELSIEEHHLKKAIHALTGLIRHLETTKEPERDESSRSRQLKPEPEPEPEPEPKPEPEPNR